MRSRENWRRRPGGFIREELLGFGFEIEPIWQSHINNLDGEKFAMPQKPKTRSSYLSVKYLSLDVRPIVVWGYDKKERFVCRLEINAAGIAVYAGKKGRKKLCDSSWERIVEKLSAKDA